MKKIFFILVALITLVACDCNSKKTLETNENLTEEFSDTNAEGELNYRLIYSEGKPFVLLDEGLVIKGKKMTTDNGTSEVVYSLYKRNEYVEGVYTLHTTHKDEASPLSSIVKTIRQLYKIKLDKEVEPFLFNQST